MKNISLIAVTVIFLLLDFCLISFVLQSPANQLKPYLQKEVRAIGYIDPLSLQCNEKGASFVLECEELYSNGNKVNYHNKLRVYKKLKLKNTKSEQALMKPNAIYVTDVPKAGKVVVLGKLQELRGFANPGSFNLENYNWVEGLGGMLSTDEVKILSAKPRMLDYFSLLNLHLRKIVEQEVGSVGVLLNGMVLGGSKGLSNEIRQSFSANGLSHLLSVSGTHLMLLASFLHLLLNEINLAHKKCLLVFLLGGYACLCGLRAPVLRALTMNAILMWGENKSAERGRIFCVLIMLFLLYKPIWLIDIGFQLSFGATAGLLWFLPKVKLKLHEWLNFSPWLIEGLAVTMTAQLATLPILINNFYTVSLISVISNILLVPVLELISIFTLVGMILSCFCLPLGSVVLKVAAWLAEQIIVQATWLQAIPYSVIVLGSLPVFCTIIYYFLLMLWFDLPITLFFTTKEKKQLLMLGCSAIVGCYVWRNLFPIPTTIYFLDVGQGDAAVIISPKHKVAVIDTGGLSTFDTGANILTPFLHSIGKERIDIFIPSHGDKDHIGGALGLARNIKIANIVLPQEKIDEENILLYDNLLKNVKGSKITYARNNEEVFLGGAKLKFIAVPDYKLKGNDASTLVELKDMDLGYKVLFTGDMSSKREMHLQNLTQYDVLKVGHHGSKSSTSEIFLEQIKPKLAVISCGYNNMYGHPHRVVIDRLRNIGCVIARTDLQGCIKVEFTKAGIKWHGYR